MNISQTILRVGATFMLFAPRLYYYYLKNYVVVEKSFSHYLENLAERVGPDQAVQFLLLKLMLPLERRFMILVGLLCLPLFFYEIVKLYKGIKKKDYSRAYILEISLLLFVVANYSFFALGFWVNEYAVFMQTSVMRKAIITLGNFLQAVTEYSRIDVHWRLVIILIVYYVLWLYRIVTARRTRSIQSAHE